MQLLANESDQLIVADDPRTIDVLLRESVGAGAAPVLKVTVLCAEEPVEFVQLSV